MCVDDIPPDIVLGRKKGCTVFSSVKNNYMNKMLFDEQLPLKRKPLKGEMKIKSSKFM